MPEWKGMAILHFFVVVLDNYRYWRNTFRYKLITLRPE